MKTIKCSSLGYTCSWESEAKTEDLLVDITSIHLRNVHGVQELTPQTISKIRALAEGPRSEVPRESGSLALKEFRCSDIGFACSWHYIAQTEDLIADGVAVHAREAHGIKEFTPEMIVQVKKAVHNWQ